MKIIILGVKGMLGTYIFSYLRDSLKEHQAIPITRKEFEINLHTNYLEVKNNLDNKNLSKDDVIINCIGLIKPVVEKCGITQSLIVNSLLPHLLDKYCRENGIRLIQISTDCVFSGKKGNYIEDDLHDAIDIYGKTKSLGEPSSSTVIRTSIIGEELNHKYSLLEWIKSNKDKEINGFSNHFWNGTSCREISHIIQEIISNNLFWKGIRHIYSDTVSKYELLCLINKIYNLNIKINKVTSETYCNRTLSSIHNPIITPISLDKQIVEMKNYYPNLLNF